MRPEIVPSAIRSISAPSCSGATGDCSMPTPEPVQRAEQIADDPVGRRLRVAPLRATVSKYSAVARSATSTPASSGRKPVFGDKARLLGVGQFGQFGAQPLDPFRVELQRQQVGIGEIAVIVRVLLRAHRPGHAAAAVEQPRLLLDRAALLDQLDLAARLVLDRLHDKAHRVRRS